MYIMHTFPRSKLHETRVCCRNEVTHLLHEPPDNSLVFTLFGHEVTEQHVLKPRTISLEVQEQFTCVTDLRYQSIVSCSDTLSLP